MSSWVGPAIQAGGAVLGGAMGGKGSGGKKAPKWLRRSANELGAYGKQLGQTPYTPYEGERVAGFTPDTLAAFDMIRNNVGAASPAYQQAIAASTGVSNYQAPTVGNVSAAQWAGQDLSPYMNPWTQNVIDATMADQQNAYLEADNALKAQGASANAFGNNRFGLAQGQLASDSVRDQALMSAQLRSQGFNVAAGLLGQDVDRQNWATGVNQQTGLANQDASLRAAALREASSRGLGLLGGAYQESLAADTRALGGAGSAQQALAQQGLDVGYGNYLDQRGWPSQQLNWWSSALAPGIAANTMNQAPTGGGMLGYLGGAQIGSQVGGSVYDWWKNRGPQGSIPEGGFA